MHVDSDFSYVQRGADFLVAEPLDDEVKDFELPGAQVGAGLPLGESSRNDRQMTRALISSCPSCTKSPDCSKRKQNNYEK